MAEFVAAVSNFADMLWHRRKSLQLPIAGRRGFTGNGRSHKVTPAVV